MKKILTLCLLSVVISACTGKSPELKSPCVGIEKSPCGPRIKVNEKWMKELA